jgi:hypothetical protein
MARTVRSLVLAAALGATILTSAPSAAAPAMPGVFAASRFDPATTSAANHRCGWGCGRWDRGWRRNRVDAGDVILGVALIGAIAAIASSNTRERDREPDAIRTDGNPYRRDAARQGERRPQRSTFASAGLDNAVTMCVDDIERAARVQSVDNAMRDAAGWEVTGTLAQGQGFRCRIGNDGRISKIDYDGIGAAPTEGQWTDADYAAARARLGGTVRPDMAVSETTVTPAAAPPRRAVTTPMPAYPGGPIPGEEIPEGPPANGG